MADAPSLAQDATTVVASCLVLTVYYLVARSVLRLSPHDPPSSPAGAPGPTAEPPAGTPPSSDPHGRARAWLLSLVVSLAVSILGVPYVIEVVQVTWRAYAASGLGEAQVALYGYLCTETSGSRQVALAFLGFMLVDLGVGFVDYRRHIDPLSGWAHHAVYVALVAYACRRRMTHLFVALSPLEIPTAMLALGSVAPHLRVDLPMGIAFAATRLGWLAFIGHVLPLFDGVSPLSVLVAPVFALHTYWFRGWLRSYAKRRRALADAAAAATAGGPAQGGASGGSA